MKFDPGVYIHYLTGKREKVWCEHDRDDPRVVHDTLENVTCPLCLVRALIFADNWRTRVQRRYSELIRFQHADTTEVEHEHV